MNYEPKLQKVQTVYGDRYMVVNVPIRRGTRVILDRNCTVTAQRVLMYAKRGMTRARIAKELNVSYGNLKEYINAVANAVLATPTDRPIWDYDFWHSLQNATKTKVENHREQIEALCREGYSVLQISEQVPITVPTLYKAFRDTILHPSPTFKNTHRFYYFRIYIYRALVTLLQEQVPHEQARQKQKKIHAIAWSVANKCNRPLTGHQPVKLAPSLAMIGLSNREAEEEDLMQGISASDVSLNVRAELIDKSKPAKPTNVEIKMYLDGVEI